ncbi:MAG: prenyltransferase [Proteobacteria bacterium]|nr:MAG: prenyltransferase [Pseudomonadota bacterium]
MIDPAVPKRLKTLHSRDQEFTSYLDGSFSEEEVAIPLRSLNVGTQTEEVTFAIVKNEDVETPSKLMITRALVRPATLIFSAGPMLAVLAHAVATNQYFNRVLATACVLGILCFQIAVNLFNDYGDHMKGQDRVRPQGGSRAIQNGWVRARKVRQMALGLTGFAALCGVPAIVTSPALLLAVVAFVIAMEFAFQRLRLKRRGFAEVLAFGLTGPLLTVGFSLAVLGYAGVAEVALGCLFGAIALLYFHSANFENIMVDSQAGARTWATRTGFEASKTFYVAVSVLCVVLTAVEIFAVERNIKLLPVLLVQLLILIPVCSRVLKLASPLSSELVGLRMEAVRLSWLTTIALTGSFFWIKTG